MYGIKNLESVSSSSVSFKRILLWAMNETVFRGLDILFSLTAFHRRYAERKIQYLIIIIVWWNNCD